MSDGSVGTGCQLRDLAPEMEADLLRRIEFTGQVDPDIEVLQAAATGGAGLDSWYGGLRAHAGGRAREVAR